ncbi:MAG: hypothetical protein H7328_00510 [Bdellovibrio sp.]|nr:hypothetical protein [Bdellovibrio sp.]
MDSGESFLQILNLTFPLIDNVKVPLHHLRLDKNIFHQPQHVFYNYKEALAQWFENCFEDSTTAKPFLELNPSEDILRKYDLGIFQYFTVHSGSDCAPKNWAPKNYEKVINKLLEIYPKIHCVSLVGPQDTELFQNEKSVRFHSIQTDIKEVTHIISGSLFHVDNDSGVHHLAGALNVPSITVFGPTGPGSWASLTSQNLINWGGAACDHHCGGEKMSECQQRVCLSSVQVDSVVKSADDILAQYSHLNEGS